MNAKPKKSPNPLQRTRKIVHLPLILLGLLFLVPLVWLIMSSLQPREQVGKIPPEWLPRQNYVVIDGEKIAVTPPEAIGSKKLLVLPQDGPDKGKQILVDPHRLQNGTLTQTVQVADRFLDQQYPATLVKQVPGDYVSVKEWTLSKYQGTQKPRTFYVRPSDVKRQVSAVFGNYPEAVRALTAGEEAKAMPLAELLAKTRWPWTPRDDRDRTITFLTYLSNTLVVAIFGVFGTVLSSALVAYGLSRVSWRGRGGLFAITLATMMVPFPVLMVPLYGLFRSLGWIGTLMPLWVPAFFGNAFFIFLLRQFFLTIPQELSDAARIDGCSEFGMFWRIILPLSKPALAVVGLFYFLFVWNDFLGPLIFLTEPDTFTMALGLQQYQSQHGGSEWHLLMAASVLLVLPIIALFFFAQRTFIQGIATTGIKG